MRIDGYGSYYPVTRTAPQGSAVASSREVQPVGEVAEETAPGQDYGYTYDDLSRPVEQASSTAPAGAQGLPVATGYVQLYERPLNSRAAQALASYDSTARLASSNDDGSAEIVGLDLYA